MKTEKLQEVLAWLKTTDLVEVQFKSEGEGFTVATAEAAPAPHYPLPASRFQPVTSPAVGLFQFSALGKARKAEEGVDVAEGESLGVVEIAKGKTVPVPAPCAGRVAKVFIEGGSPAEYGQVLLFLEPR
jgi:acetyl-CoA carboxylase biotin carboxyl carrier protein